jgi:hypothetical protein
MEWNGMELVDGKIRECVQFSRGPANFDAIDFGGVLNAKCKRSSFCDK